MIIADKQRFIEPSLVLVTGSLNCPAFFQPLSSSCETPAWQKGHILVGKPVAGTATLRAWCPHWASKPFLNAAMIMKVCTDLGFCRPGSAVDLDLVRRSGVAVAQ